MKKNLFSIALLLPCLLQAQGSWVQKASISAPGRAYPVGFSIGSKGYVGTGGNLLSAYYKDFWEWDSNTDTWTQKAVFGGTGRYHATGFSIGNKGYIGTGYDGGPKLDFWEWDQILNVWTQKANFAGAARFNAVAFAVNGKGYIGTGYWSTYKSDMWEYDPTNNTWTQKANFPGSARYRAVAMAIGSKGYIGTGFDLNSNYCTDFWEYDPTNNTWTKKADYPKQTSEAAAFAIGNKGYIALGGNQTGQEIYEWDQTGNTWTKMTNFPATGRCMVTGFAIGSKGYIACGRPLGGGSTFYSELWEFDPSLTTAIPADETPAMSVIRFEDMIKVNTGPEFSGAEIMLFDLQGKLLRKESISESEAELTIQGLAPGIYVLLLQGKEASASLKFALH